MLAANFNKVILYASLSIFILNLFPAHAQVAELNKLHRQLATTKDSTGYVDVLNRIGFISHMKSADSCLQYGIRAKTISDRLSYSRGKADALLNIATALYLKGIYSQALTLFTEALVEYESDNNAGGAMQMYMNAAVVYEVLGDTASAIEFSKKSMERGKGILEDSIMSMQYANYEYFKSKSTRDSSNYFLDKAERIATKFKDVRALLVLKQLRGDKLLQAGQYEKALPLIKDALALAREHQLEYHEITGLDYYAQYFLKRNLVDSAILCYNTSYQLALKNGFITFKTEILKSLVKAYKLKKDNKNVAKTNELLVEALEEEGRSNKNFVGDYMAYNNTGRELKEFEQRQRDDRRKIMVLVGFSFLALIAIVYILYLNKRLKASACKHIELNHKITVQNEMLVEADQFKSNLISVLAHDFRSPLASTLGMINVLKDEEFEKTELDIFYDSIETEVHDTLHTFDNILLWVKKQYSGYIFKPENLLAHDLINEAASIHKKLMADKNISLVNLIPEDTALHTDKEMIQFINRNLLHNAIKFSPENSSITVTASKNNQEVIIAVRDEGLGMTPGQQEQLFSFGKGNAVEKSAGVALTICKEFIAILKGRIWTKSEVGKGTTFFYALPLKEIRE